MKSLTRYIVTYFILMIITQAIVLCVLLYLSGCSQTVSTETVKYPVEINGKQVMATYKHEQKQNTFLSFSRTKDIYRETPFSIVTVGELENKPDPNSVKSLGEGVVSGLRGF